MCKLEKAAPVSAMPFIAPMQHSAGVSGDNSIAKMAETKNKTIEKAHRENVRATCIDAATKVAVAQNITDAERIIEIAETYLRWVEKENDGIPF